MQISKDQFLKCCDRFNHWEEEKSKKGDSVKSFVFEKAFVKNITKDNILGSEKNLERRKKNIESNAPEPVDFALERAIGKNDSVYSNFIDLIAEAKRKVGRVILRDGKAILGYATGFMVSEHLLLTNHHVFNSINSAKDSLLEFYYEYDSKGLPKATAIHRFKPDQFFYANENLDYCFVAVEQLDTTGLHHLSEIGFVPMEKVSGKLGEINEELLNIIHHPGGDLKQLSIRENQFIGITPTTIMYKSDTAQGSSGSPVFNDQFQLVGLHHSGVPSMNSEGQILDKNGQVIEEEEDGTIDESRVHWKANEGIRISVIRKHIESFFPNDELVAALLNPKSNGHSKSSMNKKLEALDPKPAQKSTTTIQHGMVNVSFPASLLESNENVSINFSGKKSNQVASKAPVVEDNTNQQLDNDSTVKDPVNIPQKKSTDQTTNKQVDSSLDNQSDDLEDESLRLERNMDYSKCKGYQGDFIGIGESIAIPKPKGKASKLKAKLKNSRSYILRYYKYSVIQNAERRLPFISAINIDGNPSKRLDKSKRKDKWIRDNRMDIAYQLENDFYARSGFDKGHMSRREDANWGTSPDEALRNANLTCVHTNACPQVPQLNRSSYGGVWGKLEKIILETGVSLENVKQSKISVFSGPIFKQTDPKRRNVQIPMEFFKVVLYSDDLANLKATAFKLSQERLIDTIDFDLEDLNLNSNIVFKEFQCSLKQLEKETSLDFSELRPYDTFSGNGAAIEIKNREQVLEIFYPVSGERT